MGVHKEMHLRQLENDRDDDYDSESYYGAPVDRVVYELIFPFNKTLLIEDKALTNEFCSFVSRGYTFKYFGKHYTTMLVECDEDEYEGVCISVHLKISFQTETIDITQKLSD